MSFLQRTSTDTPFAMTYNTGTWTYLNRPNTKTETWLTTSGTNGYSFTGKGYVFGFMSATVSSLGQLEIGDSSGTPRYQNGFYVGYPNTSRTASDDEAIDYASTTEHYRGTQAAWGTYSANSRISVIRIEAS